MWLLVSDSHDNLEKIDKAVEVAIKNNVSAVFHMGDFNSPFVFSHFLKGKYEFFGVFGNNDGDLLFLQEKAANKIRRSPAEVEFEGKKIFMMHQPFALEAAKSSQIYDFVFYGHTHEMVIEKVGKTLVINPGELCGYLSGKSTCVLLNAENGKYEVIEL